MLEYDVRKVVVNHSALDVRGIVISIILFRCYVGRLICATNNKVAQRKTTRGNVDLLIIIAKLVSVGI